MLPGKACIHRRLHMALRKILPGENLLGRTDGQELPSLHQQQTIAVRRQLLRLLLNHQDGNAGFRQLLDNAENLLRAGRIQLGGGLVQNQKLRPHGQYRGNGHSLQLSAGQVEGVSIPEFPDTQLPQHGFHTPTDLLRRNAQILKAVAHLVKDRVLGTGQLIEGVLEHQADFLAEGSHRRFSSLQAVDPDSAPVSALIELGDQAQQCLGQRAFAGAVFAQEPDEFALLHGEGDVIQGQLLRPRVAVFEMFYFDESHMKPILPRMLSSSADSDSAFRSLSCLE